MGIWDVVVTKEEKTFGNQKSDEEELKSLNIDYWKSLSNKKEVYRKIKSVKERLDACKEKDLKQI